MTEENIFAQEIAICQKQFALKKGCNWGKCADCGVIPLLYKLYKKELLEDPIELKKIKQQILDF